MFVRCHHLRRQYFPHRPYLAGRRYHPLWRQPQTLEEGEAIPEEFVPQWHGLALHISSQADQISPAPEGATAAFGVRVSAKTGEGIPELIAEALRTLVGGTQIPRGVAVPFLPQQEQLLRAALDAVDQGQDPRSHLRILSALSTRCNVRPNV